jgi:misacylated tRNA(Ala) deacylase
MNTPKKDYYAPMHTAEHILNATMVKMFDCERSENCHIERKKSKCDFILDKEPTAEQIVEIETIINEIISQNIEIKHNLIPYDTAAEKFKLRVSKEDRSKIRITSIGEYDDCPCIGVHVKNTSEIGTFKITTSTFEDNRLRLRYKLIKK